MSDAGRFRDSTQIVLPRGSLEGLKADLDREFVLSFVERADTTRIIGSPVEIKGASEWLTRQGVAVP
ncbi:VNG_1110C family protein [Halomarina litorea]|uniref:VNG_1110C family protein n=1 Tax=Halomarina litorea TaxID=2961595 RepID=UPI0020C49BB1|nr:hypothetical protein [Halomarina sp. BCD28]